MVSKKDKLLIIGSTPGSYGGMEAYMLALAEAASKWPEFEVKICFKLVKGTKGTPNLKRLAEDVCSDVRFVQSGSLDLFRMIAWADVLHVQNTPPDVTFIARLLGKKIFLTVHNWRRTSLNLHQVLWGISVKLANYRWFNSHFVWNTWEPTKKAVNSNSIPTVSKLPSGWCAPEDRKGFLFVGRWIPRKGIQELLRAYALNKFDSTEWPLTILGEGPIKEEVLALIEELGVKVNLPGFVDEETKNNYLASCRWLLAPALTKEDLGLTPIEARSVGVPSIVTRDGGLPEAGGPAALVAEPGDVADLARCMQTAATMSEEEYRKRGELAQESLKQFLKPLDVYRKAYATY